eukprot:1261815-Rhodomonas_salina.1
MSVPDIAQRQSGIPHVNTRHRWYVSTGHGVGGAQRHTVREHWTWRRVYGMSVLDAGAQEHT